MNFSEIFTRNHYFKISTLHIFVTILKNNLKCAILYGPKETYRREAFHE